MNKDFAEVPSEGNKLDIDKAFERLDAKGDESSESQSESESEETESEGADTSKSEKTDDEKETEEKLPFHKHPRWIKQKNDMKELREKLSKFESDGKDVRAGKEVELPQWWKDKFGDTPESKEGYIQTTQAGGELDWIKKEILADIEKNSQAEKNEASQAEEYVDTQMEEMTDEGLKFDKNKLLKFMVDFQAEFGAGALLDDEGNYDFRKSLKLMDKMETKEAKPDNSIRKNLAGQAGVKKVSPPSNTTIPKVDSRRLRKGGWREALKE